MGSRFRDDSLTELLETVYLMTGPNFLGSIQECVHTAQSWQQPEGALFCLQAVAGPVKQHVNNSGYAQAQQTNDLLLALFNELCSAQGRAAAHLSSPYMCATAASVIGAYAAWFDTTPAAPLEGALQLLLHSLSFPHSWHAAAGAFKMLCARCASRLCSALLVQGLASVAAPCIAPVPQAGQV